MRVGFVVLDHLTPYYRCREIRLNAPLRPSVPSAAVQIHPGAARGRPMAPQDRQSRRNAPPIKPFQKGPPRPPCGLQPGHVAHCRWQDSDTEECDLSLLDRAEDAAPLSIRIDEGTVRALLYGYEAFPVQHDQLCARSGSCGARAVSQDRASGGGAADALDMSGPVLGPSTNDPNM